MQGGWLIAVLVQPPGEPLQPHYFAVGHADQARAEWTAVDRAVRLGQVAASPVDGAEPVQAVKPLAPSRMKELGLAAGEVRELGWRRPRRWMS